MGRSVVNFVKNFILHFKPKRKYPLVIVISIVLVAAMVSYLGVLINITPSMKLGFYVKSNSPIHHGDTVAFCLPDSYKTLGLNRHYLQTGAQCDRTVSLIKEVIAVPGDHVILSNGFVEVNGIKYFYQTSFKDSEGRALGVYPRGDYPKTQGYWMIGTQAKNSWDSRYWGPVLNDKILYKLKPILTW
jgi:conjugative transfer signal peptidase TraF